MQNDDARADVFCALPENPTGLNGFDDGEEAKPVINRIGNPTMSPGNVAKMNISMPIRHGVFITRFGALADEHANPRTRVGWDQLRTTRGLARSSRKNVRA